jgi:hypothetical protein
MIPLPGCATSALVGFASLNDLGFVVGSSDAGGWIWDAADGTVLLNSLVPGWIVDNAISINNNGVILAHGSDNGGASYEYIELAAVPEPGTFVLAAAGLLFAGFARRKPNRASL